MGSIRGRSRNTEQLNQGVGDGTRMALTDSPPANEGVYEFVHRANDEDPNEPACNICRGAQCPVATRTGSSVRVGELCNATDAFRSKINAGKQETHESNTNTALKSKKVCKGMWPKTKTGKR